MGKDKAILDKMMKVSQKTISDLKALGKKGESYNTIIQRLIKFYQERIE